MKQDDLFQLLCFGLGRIKGTLLMDISDKDKVADIEETVIELVKHVRKFDKLDLDVFDKV